MALPEPLLDTAKLLEQLRELGAIGHDAAQGGRTRIALTDEEKAGRDLLVRWMRRSPNQGLAQGESTVCNHLQSQR